MGRSPELTRRTALRAITISAALLVSATATACASGQPTQAPVASDASPRPGRVIMIIRHGEKPGTPDASPGVDADGHRDKHSLTARGWTRANELVGLFAPAHGSVRPGLARPAAIYAAGGSGGEGTRPRETVSPLAAHLGVPVDTGYAKGDEAALAKHVIALPGPTLISWQHEEIPAITRALGPVTPRPPGSWPDDRFDMVWIFTATDHGWAFTQAPEMLLPGDNPGTFQ